TIGPDRGVFVHLRDLVAHVGHEVARGGLAAERPADEQNGGEHLVETALVGAQHRDAGADELGDHVTLQVREAEDEIGPQTEAPISTKGGKAADARPFARRLGSPRGARYADDAITG